MNMSMYGQVRQKQMLGARQIVSELSLPSVPSFLDRAKRCTKIVSRELYFVFTFKPMHNLHLGMSKL